MQWRSLPGGSGILTRRIEIDWRSLCRMSATTPRWFCSVWVFCSESGSIWETDTSGWMRVHYFGNLNGKPILDFSQPLTGDQLAPFGFLIAERCFCPFSVCRVAWRGSYH